MWDAGLKYMYNEKKQDPNFWGFLKMLLEVGHLDLRLLGFRLGFRDTSWLDDIGLSQCLLLTYI